MNEDEMKTTYNGEGISPKEWLKLVNKQDIRYCKVEPMITVLEAWIDGVKIEVKHKTDPNAVWIERDNPEWNFAEYEFRVKE